MLRRIALVLGFAVLMWPLVTVAILGLLVAAAVWLVKGGDAAERTFFALIDPPFQVMDWLITWSKGS